MHLFRSFKRLFGSFIILFITLLRRLRSDPSSLFVRFSLLFVFAYSLWRLLCVLNTTSPITPTPLPYKESDQHVPSIHLVTKADWDFRRLWPAYVARGILPTKGTTLIHFGSLPPFPIASHVSDPRFVLERSHMHDLFITILHGLISRVIWIYPSSLKSHLHSFHSTEELRVGVAIIALSEHTGSNFNWTAEEHLATDSDLFTYPTHGATFSDVTGITVICVCPTTGDSCSLPLWHSTEVRIRSSACHINATVTFEQVIDVLAESFLQEKTTPSPQAGGHMHDRSPTWRDIHQTSTTSTRHWLASSNIPYKLIPTLIVLNLNYFTPLKFRSLSSASTSPSLGLPDRPEEQYPILAQEFRLRLQTLSSELSLSSLDSSMSPALNATIFELTTHYFNVLRRLLPPHHRHSAFGHHPMHPFYNRCSTDAHITPHPLTSAEQVFASHWESLLSVQANRASVCHHMEPLVRSFARSIPFSASARNETIRLWHWLCSLNIEQSLLLSQWIPCENSTSSIDRDSPAGYASLTPSINICAKPSVDVLSFSDMHSNELALALDRLYSVFHHLPVPRLIILLGESSTPLPTPEDDLFFHKLCTFFGKLY